MAAAQSRPDPAERRASTMDGDKRRVFLDRLRANPFPLTAAHYAGATASRRRRPAAAEMQAADPRSHSTENSRFYVPSSGFRSLSSDSRRSNTSDAGAVGATALFCDNSDDDNLQVGLDYLYYIGVILHIMRNLCSCS